MVQEVIERFITGLLILGALMYLIKAKSSISKLIFLITFVIAVFNFFEAGKIMGEGHPSPELIPERTYKVIFAGLDETTGKNRAILAERSGGIAIDYDLRNSPINTIGVGDFVIPHRAADGIYTFDELTHPAIR